MTESSESCLFSIKIRSLSESLYLSQSQISSPFVAHRILCLLFARLPTGLLGACCCFARLHASRSVIWDGKTGWREWESKEKMFLRKYLRRNSVIGRWCLQHHTHKFDVIMIDNNLFLLLLSSMRWCHIIYDDDKHDDNNLFSFTSFTTTILASLSR